MSNPNFSYIQEFVVLLVWQLPYIAVWLVGILLALARWRKHPRVSALTLIAMVLFIGQAIVGTVISYSILLRDTTGNSTIMQFRVQWMGLNVVRTAFQIAGFALILAAIFSDRQPKWRYAPPPEVLPKDIHQPRRSGVTPPPDAIRE